MDAEQRLGSCVAIVLAYPSLVIHMLRQMLEKHMFKCLGPVSCCSTSLHAAVDEAARLATCNLTTLPHVYAGDLWSARWVLSSAIGQNCRLLSIFHKAIFCQEVQNRSPQDGEAILELLVKADSNSTKVLGRMGPKALLPLQRSLLRYFGFEYGALDFAVDLARLNLEKAEVIGGRDHINCLLDFAELLNLRAYMRTYVSRLKAHAHELEDALVAADLAATAIRQDSSSSNSRTSLVLARTLTSAAHALALNALRSRAVKSRLMARGGVEAMFQQAVAAILEALGVAETLDFSSDSFGEVLSRFLLSDRECALEQAKLIASFGEVWFCISAASEELELPLLGCDWRRAAAVSRTLLEVALSVFREIPYIDSVEYADALKDYGKVLKSCFGSDAGDVSLEQSFALHRRLLGDEHPHTLNAVRLLDRC